MRIAIVEDERLEREALKLLLSGLDPAPEIAFETANGEDAVSLFAKTRPELLLMDIQLPRISGLEAARRIRVMDQGALIVILTAYGDFSYAQQAIQIGAFDYLLKPFSREKLSDMIARASAHLQQSDHARLQRREQELALLGVEGYIRRELVQFMLIGGRAEPHMAEFFEDFLRMRGYRMRCALFLINNRIPLKETDGGLIRDAVEKAHPNVACRVYLQEIALIAFEFAGENPRDYSLPHEVFVAVPGLTPIDIARYRSEPLSDFQSLPAACRALRRAAQSTYSQSAPHGQSVLDLYALEAALCERALSGGESIRPTLDKLAALANASNQGDLMQNAAYFSHLWRQLDRYIFQVTGRRKSFPLKRTIDGMLSAAASAAEMAALLEQFVQESGEVLELLKGTHPNRVIDTVREYVKMAFAEDISLEKVAARVGFSSFYLSKLFKRETGENFKDFVIRVRMEAAKRLLAEGRLNISQVALRVGYPNAGYFSRAFRQYAGISVKDFSGK